ncbi:hypothetical protein FIV30_13850 [Lactiplantibacillus plantarum]|nr:hypothetical protein [Lactiplantibacillus plantarum]
MVNTILKEADLFCPNSVRINFTIYQCLAKNRRRDNIVTENVFYKTEIKDCNSYSLRHYLLLVEIYG